MIGPWQLSTGRFCITFNLLVCTSARERQQDVIVQRDGLVALVGVASVRGGGEAAGAEQGYAGFLDKAGLGIEGYAGSVDKAGLGFAPMKCHCPVALPAEAIKV